MPAVADSTAVDWADPAPFYMGNPDMVELADVTIKHSGLQLPAHSYVLAEAVELETPFTSHSLQEVVHMLRLCYSEAAPAAIEAGLPHLPGIARLAHSLDASRVLAGIDRFLAGIVAKKQAALEWLPLAEACQLEAAWAAGIRAVAASLLRCSTVICLLKCEEVAQLSQRAQTAVLGAVALAAKDLAGASQTDAAGRVPSAGLLQSWQHPGVQRASLTWRIPNFMQQQGRLKSPEIGSGQPGCSRKLRLVVTPQGSSATASRHVSVCVTSDFEEGGPSMLAKWTIKLVDQTDAESSGMRTKFHHELSPVARSNGHLMLTSHSALRAAADRYLVGGAAVFKVDVTWLEKPAGA
ncbi:hypothetical protein ABPG75_013148 [Micractinium tetrahymenae]